MRMTPAVILIGVLSLLATIALTMVYWPYVQQDTTPSDIFRPRAAAEEAGRKIYLANGCVYCHTQSVRAVRLGHRLGAHRPERGLPRRRADPTGLPAHRGGPLPGGRRTPG